MPSRTIRQLAARLLAGALLLLLALPVLAGKVYQWKDAQGVTHYSDAPPPGQNGMKGREVADGPAAPAATGEAGKPSRPTRARPPGGMRGPRTGVRLRPHEHDPR